MRRITHISTEQQQLFIQQFYSYFETGYAFEEFLKLYLEKMGLDEVSVTRDGGIDLRAKRAGIGGFSDADSVEYYVQAKRYRPDSSISVTKIRELKGVIPFGGKGIFITTAGFSTDAKNEANNDVSKPVILIDGKKLIESCVEKGIGFLFAPQFSRIELDRLTGNADLNAPAADSSVTSVDANITENDIRARILRIPGVIANAIPPDAAEYEVSFNGGTAKHLSIDNRRRYFARVSGIYREFGLIDAEGVYCPKKAVWTVSADGKIHIALRD